MLTFITISEYGSGRIRRGVGLGRNPLFAILWNFVLAYSKLINPLTAKLFNLNFHSLEIVSR